MRLRLLVPRGGRGRGLGGLALAAAAALVVLVVVLSGDDERQPEPPRASPAPTATATPEPPRLDAPTAGPSLAVGITEPNPRLYSPDDVVGPEGAWVRWRDALVRMRPAVLRIVVEWNTIAPHPVAPADLAMADTGCMRVVPPCSPYLGLRDQLRALAARQREGGWQALVVFTGTPAWAAAPPSGCRRDAGSGIVRRDALPAYRELVARVLAYAQELGARIDYLSPWNEPNHPYSLSPQRAACDPDARSRAIAPYGALAQAMREVVGDERLVLGETAGLLEPTSRATAVGELIAGLPRELVCAAPVWSQHAYIGGTDPVATVAAALERKGCPREHAIWITETGVGPAPGGFSLARGITSERQGCRLLHRRLRRWYADPQVTLAVQYTFREDDLFPTGLVTTDLARARPALREWQAWGAERAPDAPPPRSTC